DKAGITRRLRVAIGHADDGRLLQAKHVIDVVGPVGEERQFRRAGIAEHLPDAEGAQQVERRLLDGDGFGYGFGLLTRHAASSPSVIASEAKQSMSQHGEGWIASSLRSSQ